VSTVLASPPACVSVPPGRVGSYADDVAEVAEAIGRPLLPEQFAAVDVLTAHDARGRFLSVEAGVEMPRQNGKSGGVLLPIILWSVLTDPDHFVWSAHLLDTSNRAFADLAGRADDDRGLIRSCDWLRRRVRPPSYENGAEGVSFVNGGQLDFRARSGRRGRGLSASTVVVDEALYFTDDQAAAMLPMLATRSMRGTARAYYGSSAALAESAYLRGLRRRALDGDPTLSWAGWWARGSWADPGCARTGCAHELGAVGCALDDEALWAAANPMLGVLTSLEFIRTMRGTMSPLRFGGEFLGWEEPEPLVGATPIPARLWDPRRDPASRRAVGSSVALGVDVARDRSWAAIAVAGVREDGRQHWELIAHERGVGWLVGRVAELAARVKLRFVAVRDDDVRPSISGDKLALDPLMPAFEEAGIFPVLMGPAQIAAGCAGLADDVVQDRGRHIGQPELDRAVTGAVRRDVGDGGWALGKKASSGVDICPAYALVSARWVLGQSLPEYDLMGSFG